MKTHDTFAKFSGKVLLVSAALGFLLSAPAQASTKTGQVSVTGIGCFADAGWCFVSTDGPAAGPASCEGNDFRWEVSASASDEMYSSFLTAMVSGRKIEITTKTTCLLIGATDFPTPSYFYVFQ